MSRAKDIIRGAANAGYRLNPVTGDVYGRNSHIMTGTVASNGYRYFSICGVQVTQHQLIAFAKFGEAAFANGIEVRHKDGVRLNNRPSNILIGTRSDNMMDMEPEARRMRNLNRPSPKRILSPSEVKTIKDAYACGLRRGECTELAEKFGVSKTTISEVGKGKTYNAGN